MVCKQTGYKVDVFILQKNNGDGREGVLQGEPSVDLHNTVR
jgi:hypothetical protein